MHPVGKDGNPNLFVALFLVTFETPKNTTCSRGAVAFRFAGSFDFAMPN